MVAAHSICPGLHRVLLDEAPSFDSHRNPDSAFEVEYLGNHTAAVATYRNSQPNATDRTAALIISDALDGAIHNDRRALQRATAGSCRASLSA